MKKSDVVYLSNLIPATHAQRVALEKALIAVPDLALPTSKRIATLSRRQRMDLSRLTLMLALATVVAKSKKTKNHARGVGTFVG